MGEKLSLTELQFAIRDSLYSALPDMYWITAEISEMKENYSGHCYLDLVEKESGSDNVRAKARAIIWNNRYRFIKSLFEDATGEAPRAGMKVLVKVRIEYHELYGLTLNISDIDPSYTVGEVALRRQQIISKLESEGVFRMNRELPFPDVPLRIAVISSASAAGYADFITHLGQNPYGYRILTTLFESAMQGGDTETGILGALDNIAALADRFDAVAIIRGGGSQSDLSWFDNYNIAFHVTQFPLPVITGIGHEKDLSVTDMVAAVPLKTPTAAAAFIVERIAEFEAGMAENYTRIRDIAAEVINDTRLQLGSLGTRISYSARSTLRERSASLAQARIRLANASGNIVSRFDDRIKSYWISLEMLRPENILKRGFTLTLHNGKALRTSTQAENGSLIETLFADGTLLSRVTGRNKNNN
ncbi:MAG: exodeoxyribonuclease VII large subunit [Bacteroidales bacterium]|jgi:exodeoxyribonuclease VII large subunit|nr:exodeoxyribonuclease VII large subunit [Bacteroidales bacterium]MCU0407727.1 exodeoxyribonuclease VII large subunit [Bacteroidales bacterium]